MAQSSTGTEQDYLEDNIATVAYHLGRPGAKMRVDHQIGGLNVSEGEVLKEISRRLSVAQACADPVLFSTSSAISKEVLDGATTVCVAPEISVVCPST